LLINSLGSAVVALATLCAIIVNIEINRKTESQKMKEARGDLDIKYINEPNIESSSKRKLLIPTTCNCDFCINDIFKLENEFLVFTLQGNHLIHDCYIYINRGFKYSPKHQKSVIKTVSPNQEFWIPYRHAYLNCTFTISYLTVYDELIKKIIVFDKGIKEKSKPEQKSSEIIKENIENIDEFLKRNLNNKLPSIGSVHILPYTYDE